MDGILPYDFYVFGQFFSHIKYLKIRWKYINIKSNKYNHNQALAASISLCYLQVEM